MAEMLCSIRVYYRQAAARLKFPVCPLGPPPLGPDAQWSADSQVRIRDASRRTRRCGLSAAEQIRQHCDRGVAGVIQAGQSLAVAQTSAAASSLRLPARIQAHEGITAVGFASNFHF
jgi:hypothetical protein